ncbi:MAG: MFS transporter [Thermoplasmata archaeon]|nr:MFS transporter [Thermoplasmata archaeon]
MPITMEYKWRALGVVCIGSLMGAIDANVLIIAFPQIARELQASLVEMVWVLMIYILMGTALVLSLGRVADLKGRKRLYNAGFVVFIVGSALCGVAQTGLQLVLFRGLQGVGGAMLLANSFAILSDAFPPNERGRAFGINSVVWGTGAVFGILVGGVILTITSWRWIFWINVPIGVAATILAYLVLRESVTPNAKETFDFPAAALFTGGLAAFLYGITEGILVGWGDWQSRLPLLAALPLLVAFGLWETYVSRDPILPFGMFRSWIFSASLMASLLQGVAIFATNFLLMVYFQGILGVGIITASLLLIPLSVGLAVVGPIAGLYSDRYGARLLSTAGLLVQALALVLFATISRSTPLSQVAVYEAIMGVGGGLFFPANTSAIMGGVPRARYGVGSGIMMTLRNSSMALSFALALVALTSQLPGGTAALLFGGSFNTATTGGLGLTSDQLATVFLSGMRVAFLVAASFVLVAGLFSVLRGREVRVGVLDGYHRSTSRPRGLYYRAAPPGDGPEPPARPE